MTTIKIPFTLPEPFQDSSALADGIRIGLLADHEVLSDVTVLIVGEVNGSYRAEMQITAEKPEPELTAIVLEALVFALVTLKLAVKQTIGSIREVERARHDLIERLEKSMAEHWTLVANDRRLFIKAEVRQDEDRWIWRIVRNEIDVLQHGSTSAKDSSTHQAMARLQQYRRGE